MPRHLSDVLIPFAALRALTLLAIGVSISVGCRSLEPPLPALIEPGSVTQQVKAVLARDAAKWIDFRRDLHRHPELSGAEVNTARKVAAELRRLGMEVRTDVGGYGIVALLHGAKPGPMIAYRADMDAVATSTPDAVDFASVTPGIRHSCGHDIHTTVGLALAAALHHVRDSLAGSVMFIFQPAEERATGARAMLADGVFGTARPSEIYGLHTSGYEQGRLATTAGPMMAGRDRFEVVLSGTGDLAAAASLVTQRINALATVSGAQIGSSQPRDFVMIQLGQASPAAGQTRLSGIVFVADSLARARVATTVRNGLGGSLPSGVIVTSTYEERWTAGVTNDAARTATASASVRAMLGDGALATVATIPAGFSEDFGSFQEQAPGVFFFLGVANTARGWNGLPHSPDYMADERAIGVGALAMAAIIVDRLRAP